MKLLCLLLPLAAMAAPLEFQVRIGGKTMRMSIDRYVAGVLAGEASVFHSDEALKAMAVAARTYAVRMRGRHASEGFDFCATTHCQRLDLAAITPRLEAAERDTAGQLLWFEGKPAFACYTRDCGGRSEDAAAVWPEEAAAYLKSHDDPYCLRAGAGAWQWNADPRQVAEALGRALLTAPHRLERISIETTTASGRARTLMLEGTGEKVRIAADSFRLAMGREIGWNTVRSDRYRVRSAGGRLVFEGSGSGHGVGLCQDGADRMGAEGHTWREILAFYYPGTEAGPTARGIPWQRLSGDRLTVWTARPEGAGALLHEAERQLAAAIERTHWTPPANIDLRVYPDLDTFRNATGEPGWVAAHTSGRRIDLQPADVLSRRGALASTLRHELLHILLEAQAASDLPLWFREGLIGYLSEEGGPAREGIHPPADADLRQTADADRARRAYADADAAVVALVHRYGEAKVCDWVRTGLPPAVRNTSASQLPTKSK